MSYRSAALPLLLGLILLAFGCLLRPGASYSDQDRALPLAGFSATHLAGTDALGRDRLTRVSGALLLGLAGAVAASAVTTSIAAGTGIVAAFSPPMVGTWMMLGCDALLALPWLFLLMMVRSALPLTTSPARSISITFVVLAALGWPACARAVYRSIQKLRMADWVLQDRAAGLRRRQVAIRMLPHLLTLLLPQFLLSVPAFVIAEANLGAMGLGIGEPLPSWGGMLLELENSALLGQTGWVYVPVVLLIIVLLLLEAIAVESN